MWHAWGREEVLTGFWLGDPKVRVNWENLGVGGRITFKIDLSESGIDGANCIRVAQVGSSGGLL
jgi:hypothetical protein